MAIAGLVVSDLNAVQVRLEREQTGRVLPDDVDPAPPIEPRAALLPALDPTTMGWKDRDFYLQPDFAPAIFDWSGNCGTTAWWDGQIVGAYVQDDAGRIELIVRRDPGPCRADSAPGRGQAARGLARRGEGLGAVQVPAGHLGPLTLQGRPGVPEGDPGPGLRDAAGRVRRHT